MPFIFEGDFQLGAVCFYLAVGNDQVLLDDLGHPQLPQMFAGERTVDGQNAHCLISATQMYSFQFILDASRSLAIT